MNQEAAYWISLAHLPRWGYSKINTLVIKFFHERKLSIADFFQLSESEWRNEYNLNSKDIEDLNTAKQELPNNAFLAESLSNEGYELIPITSSVYSRTLKSNLKTAHAPALLYVKGNLNIMHEKAIAIVGSRNATEKSLEFTDNIAKLASKEYKVIVSGFAKGVDKQALDSAMNYKGHSIIVLPQGIMTFGSGFKTYYKQIINGDVLVLSCFYPKAPWQAELAMARNPVIYGMSDEIYVAESSEKGGTWSGVVDGLRKSRKIYVRKPDPGENNANDLLIQKGAIPVDVNGYQITEYQPSAAARETLIGTINDSDYERRILELLNTGDFSVRDLITKLQLPWTENKLRDFLKSNEKITITSKKPQKYSIKKMLF